jgi:hypothetical protein
MLTDRDCLRKVDIFLGRLFAGLEAHPDVDGSTTHLLTCCIVLCPPPLHCAVSLPLPWAVGTTSTVVLV